MATLAKKRQLDDIFIVGEDPAEARRLQRAAKAGDLVRLASGVYCPVGTDEEIPGLVQRHWRKITGALVPGAVVSHISAFTQGVTRDGMLTLSHPTRYNKTISLPGLDLVLLKGPGPLPGDMSLGDNLYWSSRPRMLIENLGKASSKKPRRAGKEQVEEKLVDLLNVSGEKALNQIRDEARGLVKDLKADAAFKQLDGMIGALLGTHAKGQLRTKSGQLVASGTPLDKARMERFAILADHLRSAVLPEITDVAPSGVAKTNFAFIESYFSNYVEGTKFSVDQAEEIVLHNRIFADRPKDSHDILGVFNLAMSPGSRDSIPPPGEAFIQGLQDRHQQMMANRPEAQPGELKLAMNYAGTTAFVTPAMVRGTLQEGAAIALSVPEGLARAIYYEFMISEVHPFNDGNGRMARLLMNAELSRRGACRAIIPTLFHPQYVDCKIQLTNSNTPEAYIAAMKKMALWTAQFDFADLPALLAGLRQCNALEESLARFRLLNLDGSLAA